MYVGTLHNMICKNLPTSLHNLSGCLLLPTGPPGENAVGRGSLNSDSQAQLKNATDEVFRLYVTVGVLVAVIVVLLLAVIVLVICFFKNRSVVYTLPPTADNSYSPPPPSKQDHVWTVDCGTFSPSPHAKITSPTSSHKHIHTHTYICSVWDIQISCTLKSVKVTVLTLADIAILLTARNM